MCHFHVSLKPESKTVYSGDSVDAVRTRASEAALSRCFSSSARSLRSRRVLWLKKKELSFSARRRESHHIDHLPGKTCSVSPLHRGIEGNVPQCAQGWRACVHQSVGQQQWERLVEK